MGNSAGTCTDYQSMDCEFYQEAVSATLDGAASPLEVEAVAAHLRGCPGCRRWAEEAAQVSRMSRLAPVDESPDLTGRIMAALHRELAGQSLPRPGERREPAGAAVARLALVLVAAAQLAIAVSGLLGNDAGAPVHVAREQGSWAMALAFGFLLAAWRPARANGLLPVVGMLVACLAVTATLDLIGGRTVAADEAPHALALLGFGLLWVLAHPESLARAGIGGTGAEPA